MAIRPLPPRALRLRTLVSGALALPLLFATAGCDSGGDDSSDRAYGTSSFTVSGAMSGTHAGGAVFSVVEDAGEETFTVVLFDGEYDEESGNGIVFVRDGDRPGTGTYQTDGEDVTVLFAGENGANDVVLAGESGTLTLSASSGRQVRGTFTFTGTPIGGTTATTVTGSFTADYVDPDDANGLR